METPEGVALHLHPAGVLPRAAAWAVDFALRAALLMAILGVLGAFGGAGVGLALISMFATYWLYPVLFEVLMDGQTPGKRVIGLRVIHANGTPVSWLASIVRNLMRTVDMLPVLYGFGSVASLIDPHGRRLGDMVARTLVVHAERLAPMPPLPAVPALLPDRPLQSEDKVALVDFAERAASLTPERQVELAELLSGLSGARGPLAVQRLLGYASAILGRRS